MKCLYCGKAIVGRKRKYCDRFCRNTHRDRKGGVLPIQEAYAIRREKTKERFGRQCQQCGADFIFKPGGGNIDGGKFCGRSCYAESRKGVLRKFLGERLVINGVRIGSKVKVFFKHCEVCNKPFATRHRKKECCSDECSNSLHLSRMRERYSPAERISKQCEVCGNIFLSNRVQYKCCSPSCSHINETVAKNHRQRARHFDVEYEYVNPAKVFKRDGWRCQICGKKTPKKNRGKRYPNSPELDHRVPMSKGGGHLYSNVQCSCRRCNGQKSNKDCRGQLPLFEVGCGWC